MDNPWLAFVVAPLMMAFVAAVTIALGDRTETPHPVTAPRASGHAGRRLAAVVYNPTKFDDFDKVRAGLERVCEDRGWAPPLIIATTEQDVGTGQARRAVAEGAEVVCALGGDGTVRAVAAALIGGDVPLGLLPGGTGNLLARNLDLPYDDVAEAFRVALDGVDRRIDVGVVRIDEPGGSGTTRDEYFLVMAGVGFDADVMDDAPEDVKAQFGWPAYVLSGLKHLDGATFRASVAFDGGPTHEASARSLLLGNCGKLQGGVDLIPGAEPDDGQLDAVLVAPKGLAGWAEISARVLTRQKDDTRTLKYRTCRQVVAHLDHPQRVQLDGDPIGEAVAFTATVEPLALAVRVLRARAE